MLSYSKSFVQIFPSPEEMMQRQFAEESPSCEKAAALLLDFYCPPPHSGTNSCTDKTTKQLKNTLLSSVGHYTYFFPIHLVKNSK